MDPFPLLENNCYNKNSDFFYKSIINNWIDETDFYMIESSMRSVLCPHLRQSHIREGVHGQNRLLPWSTLHLTPQDSSCWHSGHTHPWETMIYRWRSVICSRSRITRLRSRHLNTCHDVVKLIMIYARKRIFQSADSDWRTEVGLVTFQVNRAVTWPGHQ